jgi:hypothetical protein
VPLYSTDSSAAPFPIFASASLADAASYTSPPLPPLSPGRDPAASLPPPPAADAPGLLMALHGVDPFRAIREAALYNAPKSTAMMVAAMTMTTRY